ncbi:hypothetical protein CTEN210_03078 [Chaetoceros tenuissimus]|uniref:Uncharacterized protein n=1 Tax=Chaetoceros tenuissimus TaxID=426638 RepID=A0AAD3CKT9_9STRA|nr:hypothetical protein CTEN210_03078 [Chaetoceros tenuissimus]
MKTGVKLFLIAAIVLNVYVARTQLNSPSLFEPYDSRHAILQSSEDDIQGLVRESTIGSTLLRSTLKVPEDTHTSAQLPSTEKLSSLTHILDETKALRDLWLGEYISPKDVVENTPTVVEIVVTYCRSDFTRYMDHFGTVLPKSIKTFKFVIMSKCGNEAVIEKEIKDKLNSHPRFQYEIHPLRNKGGCDLGAAHYMNLFFKNETEESVRNKVVFFLKDGPRTLKHFHMTKVEGFKKSHWRDLRNMWDIASKGRFICGTEYKQSRWSKRWGHYSPSMYHDPKLLKNFMMKKYTRFNDPDNVSNGKEFTRGYNNLGDFVEKELSWSFPNNQAVEVCYGGSWAIHAQALFERKEELQKDVAHAEQLLLAGADISIVEHFLERLWAAMLSKPLNDHQLEVFMELQTEPWDDNPVNGVYVTDKFNINNWSSSTNSRLHLNFTSTV